MRTDATHAVAWARNMDRFELAGETLREALNILAIVNPDRLAANTRGKPVGLTNAGWPKGPIRETV